MSEALASLHLRTERIGEKCVLVIYNSGLNVSERQLRHFASDFLELASMGTIVGGPIITRRYLGGPIVWAEYELEEHVNVTRVPL